MEKGTLNFWNSRKNYGVVAVGKSNVYLKRHHVTTPTAPAELSDGMEVEFDREINGMEIKSTCTFTRREVS
jgi:cold shock CspA family protein|tara:strand:- start:168 stop:380 length:213 start_codon:yes stop_codon:yes gene_type:complete